MKKLLKYFFYTFFIFNTNILIADDMCNIFWNDLNKKTNDLALYEPSKISFRSYGFDIKRKINSNKDDESLYYKIDNFLNDKNTKYSSLNKINPHPAIYIDERFIYEEIQIGNSTFCERNNCDANVKEFLNSQDYLIIDTNLSEPIWSTDNEEKHFLNPDNYLSDSNWQSEYSFFISPNTNFITHIDNKPISEFSDEELIEIFYFAKENETRRFRIHSITKNTFNDLGLWFLEGHIDIDIKAMVSSYRPVNFLFKFGNFLDVKTVDNEMSFNYSLFTSWEEPKMNKIAASISNKHMEGTGFFCSMNLREYNDEDLILFYPDFRIQDFKNIQLKNEDIIIKFTYWGEGYDVEGSISHEAIVTLHKNLKLNNFPFDRQRLDFTFTDDSIDESTIYILNDADTVLFIDDYNSLDREWTTNEKDILKRDVWSVFDKIYSPSIAIDIVLDRKPSYYIFKVVLPILILLSVLFCSVLIPPLQLESKLTLTVVCFLALIAYIFVIDESVPKLSYMTLMDYFILLSFVFSAFPNIYAIYEYNFFKKNNSQHKYAKKIAILLPCLYISFLILIVTINVSTYNISTSSSLSLLK